ncbi:hypothetical protein PTI98_009470 [Pleurotus ostreatus]|nr:hypothetical protein PTI98_009470 [Pleurotus ostreatus]
MTRTLMMRVQGPRIRAHEQTEWNGILSSPSSKLHALSSVHDRDPDVLAGVQSVTGVLHDLKNTPYTVYGDDPIGRRRHGVAARRRGPRDDTTAREPHRRAEPPPPLLECVKADDENRAWHFERADGSLTRVGKSRLFWYRVQDIPEVERIIKGFETKGRIDRSYLPVGPAAPPRKDVGLGGVKKCSTLARKAMPSYDVAEMEKGEELDAWAVALPNGAYKPFVEIVVRRSARPERAALLWI